jgi:signal transduction histidine kinase
MNVILQSLRWFRQSLRLRLLVLVFLIVLGSILLMAFFAMDQFKKMSTFQLEHEALALSDMLEVAIAPSLAGEPDVAALQAHIDRVVAARELNDIEINIMLRQGYRSTIVASNIPDNVAHTDIHEHRDLLAALESEGPIIFIGRDDDSTTDTAFTPGTPDDFILPGQRFISVTTPLIVDGQKLGSINTKLSLSEIDERIAGIRHIILLICLLLPTGALVLVFWAIQKGLRPMSRLANEVAEVDSSKLDHRFSTTAAPLEIQPIVNRLNELLERLETSFQRERRFTSDVSHELRTPIATLKTISEVGIQEASGPGGDENYLGFFQDAHATASQMGQLVESLMSLARCEAGLQKIDFHSLTLGKLIESAWQNFEAQAQDRKLDCQFDLTDNASVHSDQALLGAIVRNLLANAIAYTEKEGSLHCTLANNGDGFIFSLTNTCRDLAEDELKRMFEPFWRKDKARSDAAQCGLGLALVQAYARLLDIEINAERPQPDLLRITLGIPARPSSP